jgi:hypothetical protein
MMSIALFDVSPGPVNPGVGLSRLMLVGFVVLMMTTALIMAFVFLLKAITRARKIDWSTPRRWQSTRLMIGDVCLSVDGIWPKTHNDEQRIGENCHDRVQLSSPNQP